MPNNSIYEEHLFLPQLFKEEEVRPNAIIKITQSIVAEDDQFGFIVILLLSLSRKYFYRCTGSLISSKWVITAAHCLTAKNIKPKNILLVGGKANLSVYLKVRKNLPFTKSLNGLVGTEERVASFFVVHPHFDEGGAPHDVGLVKTKEKFFFLIPILLHLEKVRKPLTNCTIVGWGEKTDIFEGLMKYKTNIIMSTPELGCKIKKKGSLLCFNVDLIQLCLGDVGSPIICNNKLYGITSHHGHLKGYPLFEMVCHAANKYYVNSIYYEKNWLATIIRQQGSIICINWQIIFLSILLWILLSK